MTPLPFLGLVALAASQSVTTLKPPANAPNGAAKKVDPSFPSFAIQGSSFPAYTGMRTHNLV